MSRVDSHAKRAPKHPQRAKAAGKGAEDAAKDAPKPQAGSWKEGFVEADKNHDGKLTKARPSAPSWTLRPSTPTATAPSQKPSSARGTARPIRSPAWTATATAPSTSRKWAS